VGVEDELIVEDLVLDPRDATPAALEALRATAQAEPLIHGFVVSRDGAATVVNAVVQLPADRPNAASLVAAAARDIREAVAADHPGHAIHITGVASLSAAFEEAGLRDSATLIPAVYALILVVLGLTLRSVSAVAASLAVIALSTLIGMGAGGWSGVLLTPISLSAPTIILTIAVADAVHILAAVRAKMRAGLPAREAIVAAVALNFSPVAITSITTVAGFLTLNFSDSPPFHHLGNITAAGVAAAWVLSVTFLPALLSLLPLRFGEARGAGALDRAVAATAEAVIARPRPILAAGLALTLGAAALIPSLGSNDQWSRYFAPSLEFRGAIDAAAPFFGSDQVDFVLDPGAAGEAADPAFLQTVDRFAGWLRTRPEVAHAWALPDVMKRVNRALNGGDEAFLAIPDDRALASQHLLVYELSLPYGLTLSDRVDIDRRETRVTATMRDGSTADTRAFLEDAAAWWAANGGGYGFRATGSSVMFAFVAERNIAAMVEGAAWLVAAIFAILALSFRSVGAGLLSVVANVLPLALTFGVWAAAVGLVGFSVAAVGAVAVGLIVDYAVHFLSKYLRARRVDGASVEDAVRYAFATAGAAITVTTVILTAGFAVLATSAFKLNADLGLLTALAIVFALGVNLLVLPSLLLSLPRRGGDRIAAPAAA
jgi:predicted RND superfamily exporter protein